MRKTAWESSPPLKEAGSSTDATLVQSVQEGDGDSCGITDKEVMVRRSTIAPCVSCVLCGGLLCDATTIPDCLHSCKLHLGPPNIKLISLVFSVFVPPE